MGLKLNSVLVLLMQVENEALQCLKRCLTATQNLSTAPTVAARRSIRRICALISTIPGGRSRLKGIECRTSTSHGSVAGKIVVDNAGCTNQLRATVVLRVLVLNVKVKMANDNAKNFVETSAKK